MPSSIKVPALGESITEAIIANWLQPVGARVEVDQPLVELETDKVTVEVPSPVAGILTHQSATKGSTVRVGEIIGEVEVTGASEPAKPAPPDSSAVPVPSDRSKVPSAAMPSARAEAARSGVDLDSVAGTGRGGRILKEDVQRAAQPPPAPAPSQPTPTQPAAASAPAQSSTPPAQPAASAPAQSSAPAAAQLASRLAATPTKPAPAQTAAAQTVAAQPAQPAAAPAPAQPAQPAATQPATAPAPAQPSQPAAAKPAPAPSHPQPSPGGEEIVAMSPLRRRVAERLVQAQSTAAILTTFNEVDMSAVYKLRAAYKQNFVDKHGVKLGFMSFFVKATVAALKAFPAVNAEIRGDNIVYKHYYDIGVAVGGGKGLVVPVVRAADTLGFAEVEKEIARLGARARDNKLTLEELSGGTFTISNGGVYGSMLSTPILNPPQSGILGLHNIVERPVAINGAVEIRPIMYLALSYDHRLVDGREAVQFLVHIKERIEAPERLMLEV